jgi:hypothetical protein
MSKDKRSDSRSPEKMQGNPPALDPSKFGNSDLASLPDADSSLDKANSPLANPKVKNIEGSMSALTRRKSGNILAVTPRSFRGERFIARRISSPKTDGEFYLPPEDSNAINQKCYDSEPDQLIKRRVNLGDLYARTKADRCRSITPCSPSALFTEDDSPVKDLKGHQELPSLNGGVGADAAGLQQNDANQLHMMLKASIV